jgi:K319L-like, PKD domain
VSAGPDLIVTLPTSATLDGTVSDDGAIVSTTWSQVSGPSTPNGVDFAESAVDTTATFPGGAGTYVLRLTAVDDGAPLLSASDDATITVNPPLSVSTIFLSLAASSGTVGGFPSGMRTS